MSGDFDEMDCAYKKRDLISYILNVGEARQILTELLRHEIFDDLSKHSRKWMCECEGRYDLDDIRMRINYIQEKLYEIQEKLD